LGANHTHPHRSFHFGAFAFGAEPQAIAASFLFACKALKMAVVFNHIRAQKSYIKSRKKV
jgi:hypothetical protein